MPKTKLPIRADLFAAVAPVAEYLVAAFAIVAFTTAAVDAVTAAAVGAAWMRYTTEIAALLPLACEDASPHQMGRNAVAVAAVRLALRPSCLQPPRWSAVAWMIGWHPLRPLYYSCRYCCCQPQASKTSRGRASAGTQR